jgi:hypothetical protein
MELSGIKHSVAINVYATNSIEEYTMVNNMMSRLK